MWTMSLNCGQCRKYLLLVMDLLYFVCVREIQSKKESYGIDLKWGLKRGARNVKTTVIIQLGLGAFPFFVFFRFVHFSLNGLNFKTFFSIFILNKPKPKPAHSLHKTRFGIFLHNQKLQTKRDGERERETPLLLIRHCPFP